jgi:hypothetical protein
MKSDEFPLYFHEQGIVIFHFDEKGQTRQTPFFQAGKSPMASTASGLSRCTICPVNRESALISPPEAEL